MVDQTCCGTMNTWSPIRKSAVLSACCSVNAPDSSTVVFTLQHADSTALFLVANTEERRAISMLQSEDDRAAIGCVHALEDSCPERTLVKGGMLLHQVKGEHHIRAGERLPVVPFHVCAQLASQLCQIGRVGAATRQPGRGLTGVQVGEVQLFIEQTLRPVIATLVGVEERVKEIGVGLPWRREDTKGC